MRDAVITNYYLCFVTLQGKTEPNYRTDIDIVVVVLRDNYLKEEN